MCSSDLAVIRAMQAYERGGWKAVAIPIVGRPPGSGRMLTAEQEKKIQQLIQDRTPDQLKLSYALWTRQAVSELIEAVYASVIGLNPAMHDRVKSGHRERPKT